MKKLNIFFLGLMTLCLSKNAAAAETNLAVLSGGYVLCLIFAGLALYTRMQFVNAKGRARDLEMRLAHSEKSITQLHTSRSELNSTLNMAKAKLVSTEQQRKETADMLASLRTQVERVARVDGLTGVANRQQFGISLHDEIKRCVRERKEISVLIVEIDSFIDFKDINGEQKSEFTLQRIAKSISDSFRRAGDLVARIGEFQFGVLLPGTDADTAARFAEKMRRLVYAEALPFPTSEIADRITVSVGIASLPPVRLHKADLAIALAQEALGDAIENGCNQVVMSQSEAA